MVLYSYADKAKIMENILPLWEEVHIQFILVLTIELGAHKPQYSRMSLIRTSDIQSTWTAQCSGNKLMDKYMIVFRWLAQGGRSK